jgi:hypothetical protein
VAERCVRRSRKINNQVFFEGRPRELVFTVKREAVSEARADRGRCGEGRSRWMMDLMAPWQRPRWVIRVFAIQPRALIGQPPWWKLDKREGDEGDDWLGRGRSRRLHRRSRQPLGADLLARWQPELLTCRDAVNHRGRCSCTAGYLVLEKKPTPSSAVGFHTLVMARDYPSVRHPIPGSVQPLSGKMQDLARVEIALREVPAEHS